MFLKEPREHCEFILFNTISILKMTQYTSLNAKWANFQLNKLKSAIKIDTEVTLNFSSNMIGDSNDDTNFSHRLLLSDRQLSKFYKALANNLSANIKLLESQSCKLV